MALLVLWSLKVVFCWAWDELKQNCRLSATKVSFSWIGLLILFLIPLLPADNVVIYFW